MRSNETIVHRVLSDPMVSLDPMVSSDPMVSWDPMVSSDTMVSWDPMVSSDLMVLLTQCHIRPNGLIGPDDFI